MQIAFELYFDWAGALFETDLIVAFSGFFLCEQRTIVVLIDIDNQMRRNQITFRMKNRSSPGLCEFQR